MSSEPAKRLEPSLSVGHVSGDGITTELGVDQIIEVSLELLVQRGPMDDPETLRKMIPQANPEIQQFALIELIKMDMAMAAEGGQFHRIERYIRALPDLLSASSIPLDLIMEEIQLRKESGENPSRDEYATRFPQFASMFSSILGQLAGAPEASCSVEKMGTPPEQAIGGQLDDFLIVQKLGQGAFAHVYLARQLSMHRLVALKVSRGNDDEPQALAQFDHPNIVRVFDQRTIDEQKLHLLYMQFHPGGTLADVVRAVREDGDGRRGEILLDTVDRNLLSAAQVVPDRSSVRDWMSSAEWPTVVAWLGVQLARALDDAHSHGVLHRDVKPANVLLSAEGIPKLADFNVSQAGAAGRAGAATCFGGSIGYMAPEHLRAIDPRIMDDRELVRESADLYSLAILLWELWQGHRPFVCSGVAISWSDTVAQQLAARDNELVDPKRIGSASERVLEKALRRTLAYAPEDRLSSGAEMAGRLRLALHPEAAGLFDPGEDSIRVRVTRLSPWLVAGAVILLPHVAAGFFNYQYNLEILSKAMQVGLAKIAFWVNLVAYPLGVPVMLYFTRGLARAVQMANEGSRISPADLRNTLDLGHRAALIGGAFWMIAGIIYPLALWSMYPAFTTTQAVHFFVSLLICGGVAMIYPFFGCALISTLAYYPRLLSGSMQDNDFDARAYQMVRRCEAYRVIAIIIPLLAAALMISGESSSKGFMLTAIGAAMIGSLASLRAFRIVSDRWTRMGEVLSARTSVVPGEDDGNYA